MLGVVALGLLGAAYTLWYEDLTLHADVTTGTFDFDWSCDDAQGEAIADPNCEGSYEAVVSLDNGTTFLTAAQACAIVFPAGDCNDDPQDLDEEIDVIQSKMPTCDLELPGNPGQETPNTSNTVGDLNDLTIELDGLYPYAGCRFWINITNQGSVPGHLWFTNLSVTGDQTLPPALAWSVDANGDQAACQALFNSVGTTDNNPVKVGQNYVQLHEGDDIDCHFVVSLKQENVEGQSAVINITWTAAQWNEVLPNPNHP